MLSAEYKNVQSHWFRSWPLCLFCQDKHWPQQKGQYHIYLLDGFIRVLFLESESESSEKGEEKEENDESKGDEEGEKEEKEKKPKKKKKVVNLG